MKDWAYLTLLTILSVIAVMVVVTSANADQFDRHIAKIDTIGWDTIPSWYIIATGEGMVEPPDTYFPICDTTYDDKVQVWLTPDQLEWLSELIDWAIDQQIVIVDSCYLGGGITIQRLDGPKTEADTSKITGGRVGGGPDWGLGAQ